MARIDGTPGNNDLEGTDGDDRIRGFGGRDRIEGKRGNDDIDGGSGPDVIRGGKGDDRIEGGRGDDKVDGQNGADNLFGGLGSDSFLAGDDGAQDRIQIGRDDLRAGDVDRIEEIDLAGPGEPNEDVIIFQNQRDFLGVLSTGQIRNQADLAKVIEALNTDGSPVSEAFNADPNGSKNAVPDDQLVLRFENGYELRIDDLGELAQQEDPNVFQFRNQTNEARKFAKKADPSQFDYVEASEVDGLPGRGVDRDGKLMLISDFDLAEGDVLKFDRARNLNEQNNSDGLVGGNSSMAKNRAEFALLEDFLVAKVDADGDGVRNDLYFEVDPDGGRNRDGSLTFNGEGYDFVLLDIGGTEVDDFNDVNFA